MEEDEADEHEREEDGMSPYRPIVNGRRTGSTGSAGGFRESLDDDASLY